MATTAKCRVKRKSSPSAGSKERARQAQLDQVGQHHTHQEANPSDQFSGERSSQRQVIW